MTLDQIASLTPQAMLVLAVVALWRGYVNEHNARIDDLKTVISNLNARMIMVEDRLGIQPPLTTATFDKSDKP
jgi:hypothetical protein